MNARAFLTVNSCNSKPLNLPRPHVPQLRTEEGSTSARGSPELEKGGSPASPDPHPILDLFAGKHLCSDSSLQPRLHNWLTSA